MIYRDPVTKRPIEYTENNVFIVFIRSKYHKKRAIRYFSHNHLPDALDFYYKYEIPETHYKYLHINDKEDLRDTSGTVIFKMKGHLPSTREMKLRIAKKPIAYDKVPTLNLIHTPVSIARKMKLYDFSKLPIVHEAWTKTRLVYCLLSYFFSLSNDEQHKLMDAAYKLYINEKLLSGGKMEESSKMMEIIKSDEDISLL